MSDYDGCYELADRLLKWGRVRVENGHTIDFVGNPAVVLKSCLFMRVVHQGKEPLPYPPPTAYSAPWYSLIESGNTDLHEIDVSFHEQAVYICQCPWQIVEKSDDGEYIVRFAKMPEEEKWTLTPATVQRKRYEVGKPVQLVDYPGWILQRQEATP